MNSTSALLLVDIQNDYFEGGANPLVGSPEAAEKAASILANFRATKQEVIFIQHLTTPESSFFKPGSYGAAIHDAVKPSADELVLTKNAPNSFLGTHLHETLQAKGIKELVIVGMMSHMCIDATTRAASDLGYTCTVIADACATKDLQFGDEKIPAKAAHNAFMAALASAYATVLSAYTYQKG